MPSTTPRFSIAAGETWAEVGGSARIAFATDAGVGDSITGPPSGKFSWDTTSAFASQTEKARTKAYLWTDLGVPAGATVNSVQVPSYYTKDANNFNNVANSQSINVVDSTTGAVVHSAGSLSTRSVPAGANDLAFVNRTPATTRNVDATWQPAASSIKLEVSQTVDNSGTPGAGTDTAYFDTIDLLINYTLPTGVKGWVCTSVNAPQGLLND